MLLFINKRRRKLGFEVKYTNKLELLRITLLDLSSLRSKQKNTTHKVDKNPMFMGLIKIKKRGKVNCDDHDFNVIKKLFLASFCQ